METKYLLMPPMRSEEFLAPSKRGLAYSRKLWLERCAEISTHNQRVTVAKLQGYLRVAKKTAAIKHGLGYCSDAYMADAERLEAEIDSMMEDM